MGEWRRMVIADAIDLISGGTPKTSVPDYWGGKIPWLSVADFNTGYRWVDTAEKNITESGLSESATTVLNQGDIIISARGTVGVVAQLARSMAFNQSCYGVRGKRGIAETDFLYYALRHSVTEMKQVAHGGVFDTITRDTFKIIEVDLPSLPEQRAIAHILGTLDDKIELNRRMNETLEAIARALFKSWFVDFDPVHAKAEGRDTGLPKHLADLFSDSFEDSELGEIPRGWTTRSLYDTASFINGAAFRSEDFCASDEGLPVIKIAELKDGISSQTKYSCRVADDKQRIDTGDLIYSWSGSPDTSLDAFLWPNGPGLLNQHIFKVVAPDAAQKRFVYYLLKYLRPVLVETARNKQTTGLGHVTVADMKRLFVSWPTKEILASFDQKIAPIFDRAFTSTIEAQTLVALRDTLLPKFISGELRIPERMIKIEAHS